MKNSVTIISDGGATGAFVYGKTSTLWAEDVEHCIGELCKAVGARYDDAADVQDEGSYGYEWKGTHGSVYYETDEDKFHLVQVDFDDTADMLAVMQIACVMCSEGCVATYYDANGKEIDL